MISCRLDRPGDPSSILGESFLLEGSLRCEQEMSGRSFEMGLVIQSVSGDCAISSEVIADEQYIRLAEVSFNEGERASFNCFLQRSGEGSFYFSAAFLFVQCHKADFAFEVDCRRARQSQNSQSFTFTLCLREQGFSAKPSLLQCSSNRLRISVLSQEERAQAFGGFLYPESCFSEDSFILVDGWAYRSQDTVQQVLVHLGEECLGSAYYGAWSPFQHAVLADGVTSAEDSVSGRCRFQLALPNFVSSSGLRRKRLRAEVLYTSGFRQQIVGPELSGKSTTRNAVALEEMSTQPGGCLQVALRACGEAGEEGELFMSLPGADCQLSAGVSREGISALSCDFSRERLPDGADVFGTRALDRSYRMKFRLPGSLLSSRAVFFYRDSPNGRLSYVPLAEGIFPGLLRRVWSLFYRFRLSRKLSGRGLDRVSFVSSKIDKADKSDKAPVLFCLHNLTLTEGAPRVAIELMLEVMRRGVFSGREVVCLSAQDGDGAQVLRSAGVSVYLVPELSAGGQSWKRYGEGMGRLESLLRQKPALVYANVIDCFWGVDYAGRVGCPSVWAIHEGEAPDVYYRDLDARVRRQFLRMLRRAEELLFVSQTSHNLFAPWVKQAKQVIVRNGVRLPEVDDLARRGVRNELGLTEGAFVCLCLGTTCKRKGQDLLLSALSTIFSGELSVVDPKVHCLFVGARPSAFLDSLKAQVESELGASAPGQVTVSFVAETEDVEKYFLAADLCVCPSRAEASPLVSLEAMSYGLPLLVSDIAAYREQLGNQAAYFRAGDFCSLAAELAELISDEQRRTRLGREGREKVASEFGISATHDAHIAVMLDVISGSR